MPIPAWMKIEGRIQGAITEGAGSDDSIGGLGQTQNEDMCLIWSWDHSIVTPTDRASGMATGKREHHPVNVTKLVDKCSPMIYTAICRNEKCDIEVIFFKMHKSAETHFFTIKLYEAIISQVRTWMPIITDPLQGHLQFMEDLSIRYRKIEWTNVITSTTSEDDWKEGPV